MQRILVTGGTGQVAAALRQAAPDHVHLVGRPVFDFDAPATIPAVFQAVRPTLVVNAAAYTAVDAAEDDSAAAYRANSNGAAILAGLCAETGVPLIHLSTDYVFDGAKGSPYVETDSVAPQGVYGASKLAGEQAVLAAGGQAVILRTSWVYAAHGRNFVRTMLTAAQTRNRLTVVADQQGCPTAAVDLAAAILAISQRIAADGWQPGFGGVFHAAGTGATSWFGLAQAIFAAAARHGARVPEIAPIATVDWPTRAKRPADSRLDCTCLKQRFGIQLPEWTATLPMVVAEIMGVGVDSRSWLHLRQAALS